MPRSSGTGARVGVRVGVRVLIVGAGPVGLTAAHELARRGIPVRVVDAAPGPRRAGGGGRGAGVVVVHPRTLEVFDQMGVVGPLLEQGRRNRAFTMTAGGGRSLRLDAAHASAPTRYPCALVIEQARTEGVLRKAVARLGVRVEWGVRLTSFDQDEDGVRAYLEHPGGRREVCAVPWLVGCDGARSTVRARLRLPEAVGAHETWEVADAAVCWAGSGDAGAAGESEEESEGEGSGGGSAGVPGGGSAAAGWGGPVQDGVHWVHTGGQVLLMLPHRRAGYWRLLDSAPADRARDGRPVELRLAAKLSAGLGREVRVGAPLWSAVQTFRVSVATRMGQGRCFVAGDAAHVYGPASGHGLNTGVQDAYNLAWKLAMVEQGWVGRELLGTYEEERVPVARALLGAAGRAGGWRTAAWLTGAWRTEAWRTEALAQVTNALAGVALPAVVGVVGGVGVGVGAVRGVGGGGGRGLLQRVIGRRVLGELVGGLLGGVGGGVGGAGAGGGGVSGGGVSGGVAGLGPSYGGRPGGLGGGARVFAEGLRGELRDVRWSLLYVPEGTGEAAEVARAAAARHAGWLSVRAVVGEGWSRGVGMGAGVARRVGLGSGPGPRVLVDPGGGCGGRWGWRRGAGCWSGRTGMRRGVGVS
ncbi:FAD-dependent monooxygenase [Streptomyces sp. NPDC006529]|uniref:FAD-dependent monooxygenase n=1 Tax=Streptomyces sp. NPDC006529 TaxID=3157177 RepID=UPI0033BA778E